MPRSVYKIVGLVVCLSAIASLVPPVSSAFLSSGRKPFRSDNFKACCSLGKEASNSTHLQACNNYSNLKDRSGGCQFAFTICCNQNRRTTACESGKKHAYSGGNCQQLANNKICESAVDCCNCCELGIKTRKNGDDCTLSPVLDTQCNAIFMDCCKYATSYDDCSNKYFCPSGQVCENTFNGPICKCPTGFEKDFTQKFCIDIDECKRADTCPLGHTCSNTLGSFKCTRECGLGYTLDEEANQCKDINECFTDEHTCVRGMRCENYPGSYRCIREKPCGTGYSVNAFTQECDDVDECLLNIHDCARGFTCKNVPGSYKCIQKKCDQGYVFNYNRGDCERIVCKSGFEMDLNGACVDIDECKRSRSVCRYNEKCLNTVGSYKCHLEVCDMGYEVSDKGSECVDIDECSTGRHNCPSLATCHNLPGTFKCVCPNGYRLDAHRNICEDLDECAFGQICPNNAHCRNSPGSYSCDCQQGFKLISHIFHTCADINECENSNICDHGCINTHGSFQCTCREGYTLGPDKRACVDIDECSLPGTKLCSGRCTNLPGSYKCGCDSGFILDRYREKSCEDINECLIGTHNCDRQDVCVNTWGGFKCIQVECPAGYEMISNPKSPRCDRERAVCRYGDPDYHDCLRRPMKIFYSHSTFSHLVPLPVKIFTTRVTTYSRRIKYKYELKLISASGSQLTEDEFKVKQVNNNTFEIYLLKQCHVAQNIQLDLKIEFYNEATFSSCLLNKVFVFITE